MVEGAVAGSSTGEGGYGERDGSAAQPYPTHQKTEIQRRSDGRSTIFAPPYSTSCSPRLRSPIKSGGNTSTKCSRARSPPPRGAITVCFTELPDGSHHLADL